MTLTDEELSRVLSQQAVGKLIHDTFGRSDDDPDFPGCGCVAGAALNLIGNPVGDDFGFAQDISKAVDPGMKKHGRIGWRFRPYPKTPEGLLRYLHQRGLA